MREEQTAPPLPPHSRNFPAPSQRTAPSAVHLPLPRPLLRARLELPHVLRRILAEIRLRRPESRAALARSGPGDAAPEGHHFPPVDVAEVPLDVHQLMVPKDELHRASGLLRESFETPEHLQALRPAVHEVARLHQQVPGAPRPRASGVDQASQP